MRGRPRGGVSAREQAYGTRAVESWASWSCQNRGSGAHETESDHRKRGRIIHAGPRPSARLRMDDAPLSACALRADVPCSCRGGRAAAARMRPPSQAVTMPPIQNRRRRPAQSLSAAPPPPPPRSWTLLLRVSCAASMIGFRTSWATGKTVPRQTMHRAVIMNLNGVRAINGGDEWHDLTALPFWSPRLLANQQFSRTVPTRW